MNHSQPPLHHEILHAALFPNENPFPVLRANRQGVLLYANPAAAGLLLDWQTSVGEVVPELIRHEIAKALAEGVNRELDIRLNDRDLSFILVPIAEHDYVNFYGRDLTERKRAEEMIRRGKEEWERTFDSVPDLIAILDEQHRITRINRAMAERLGVTPQQCIGKTCFQALHKTDHPPASCPHTLTMADACEHQAEVREESLGGDFLVTTTPLFDAQGVMIGSVHVARDITERKRAEELIQRYVEGLQATNEELTRFNNASIDRELRMIELKKEINELCVKAGEQPRYPLKFAEE